MLGLVDFALHPHLDHEWFPENSLANLEKLASTLSVPSYAIDDQTAIKVTDGVIEVVSEGIVETVYALIDKSITFLFKYIFGNKMH